MIRFVLFLFCFLFPAGSVSGATGEQLEAVFDQMFDPELEDSAFYQVSGLVIEHNDLRVYLEHGRIYFCQPALIDGVKRYFGAYFKGRGSFQFAPSIGLERDQMRRFFDTDSLNLPFESAEFLFDDYLWRLVRDSCALSYEPLPAETRRDFKSEHKQLTHHEQRTDIFHVLKCLIDSTPERYLLVNLSPEGTDRVCYRYYPYDVEKIRFFRNRGPVSSTQGLELICSYSPGENPFDPSPESETRDQLAPIHYDIQTSIDNRGECFCRAELTFTTNDSVQATSFSLHPRMEIDSILDSNGQPVRFKRWTNKRNQSPGLYLFLNMSLPPGATSTLTFFYHGEIAERYPGEFIVQAGAAWYPRAGYRQKTTYNLQFKTPKRFGFSAVGKLVDSTVVKDTLFTRWQVEQPSHNVSFNIGVFDTYFPTRSDVLPEGVDFTNPRQQQLLDGLVMQTVNINRTIVKNVARDVMGSLLFFENQFGLLPIDRLVISEILASHSEAFPGFVHMGFETFRKAVPDSYQRQHRSHEVAHQWWGIGVGHKSYHDQWLSEGFAEYSGLMYVEAAQGKDDFLMMLRTYREKIFDTRSYLLSSGAESGPIIMGYRTASSQTRGDFNLIIYKKAALVLHMLRVMLTDLDTFNDDRFFRMMKDWYLSNRGKQMSTHDFKLHCDKYFGRDMGWFFDQWVYGNDLPAFRFTYECERAPDGYYTCRCEVITEGVDSSFMMPVPIEIQTKNKGTFYLRRLITGNNTAFEITGLDDKPKRLRFNPFEAVLGEVKQ